MSKDQDSKGESVQQSDEAGAKPGSSRDTADLVDVKIIEQHGQSVLVQYEADGIPYRSSVDALDLVDSQIPRERLADAPYGITWDLKFSDIARNVELELKKAKIWTFEDLQEKDRQIIRIATSVLGRAIWQAAKSGSNRRQQ